MAMVVGLYRAKTDIRFLDGDDDGMLRRMRGHGNFTENVPIALLAMGAAEISGAPDWVIWGGGAVLMLGRLVHYSTIRTLGWGPGRLGGMMMTLAPIGVFALTSLYFSFL